MVVKNYQTKILSCEPSSCCTSCFKYDKYLCILLCLGLAYVVKAQTPGLECPSFTIDLLGSTTEFSTAGLLAASLDPVGELPVTVQVRVLRFHTVCEATGERRPLCLLSLCQWSASVMSIVCWILFETATEALFLRGSLNTFVTSSKRLWVSCRKIFILHVRKTCNNKPLHKPRRNLFKFAFCINQLLVVSKTTCKYSTTLWLPQNNCQQLECYSKHKTTMVL